MLSHNRITEVEVPRLETDAYWMEKPRMGKHSDAGSKG